MFKQVEYLHAYRDLHHPSGHRLHHLSAANYWPLNSRPDSAQQKQKKKIDNIAEARLKGRQPEVAVNYSCLIFLSFYNLFINKNYLKKWIKYRIKFIYKNKLK